MSGTTRPAEDDQLLSDGGTPAVAEPTAGETTEAATENTSVDNDNDESKIATASAHSLESGPTENDSLEDTQKNSTLRFAKLWKFEVLSMVCSVGALLAIIAVLFAYDGKSMTRWNAGLRPNTVVSALSTLAKSSMLMVVGQGLGQLKWQHFERRPRRLLDFDVFENASRGPWGSLRLLYYINWKALAGSTGAIITILALAMDPFAQQVISFDSRQVNADNMTSTIRAARTYDMNSQWESSTDASSHSGYNRVKDTKIIGAIYQAMFGSNTAMPFDCPSGDCTWESYKSLGICSSCVDVTAATNTTRVCEDGEPPRWAPTEVKNRTCHYETPSGYRLDGRATNWFFMRDYEQYHTLWNSTTEWENPRDGEYQTPPDQGIATIAALKFVEYDDMRIARPEIWLESAHECTLSWCAIEYGSSNAENGQLNDEPTHSTPLTRLDKIACHENGTGEEGSMSPYAWSTSGMSITKFIVPGFEPDNVPENLTCYSDNGAAYGNFSQNPDAFWLNTQDDLNLQNALSSMFTTSFESITNIGDDRARALFRSASLPDTMDEVASSMTIQIRTGPNQTDIHGSVQIGDQHIHVRWPWMILPASLVLLSAVFLIVSMAMATRECRGWKSSVLPGFYHGLSGWEARELHTRDIEDMERSAKGMWVRLGDDEEGSAKLLRSNKPSD